jgi:hypothetical protein
MCSRMPNESNVAAVTVADMVTEQSQNERNNLTTRECCSENMALLRHGERNNIYSEY